MAQELRRTSHLETALQEREQRFRAIFDGALQFIGLLSPEGIVLENNRTALEFLQGHGGRDDRSSVLGADGVEPRAQRARPRRALPRPRRAGSCGTRSR